jgi:8-oxo-dGTP pyrophosphatase MutT (NUDIX family)
MVESRFESRSPRGWRYDRPAADARLAGVLVLLYPREGRWHLPLTLRPAHLPAHAGQVSLPGGALSPGETSREAAIREFHEELGAEGLPIRVLGRLSPIYTGASNFLVDPWVAVTDRVPQMTPNPQEVAELIEAPLAHLVDRSNFGSHERRHQGQSYTAPHFFCPPHQVWGATCMILGELVTLLEEISFREE